MTNAYKIAAFSAAMLMLASTAYAAGGTITFQGKIVEDTCRANTNDRLQPNLSGCDAKVARTARIHVEQSVVTPATRSATTNQGAQKLAVVVTEYL